MKIFKIISSLVLALGFLTACSERELDTLFIDNVAPPSDLSILMEVSQDNTGTVTLTPFGTGVASYSIVPGDNAEMYTMLKPGNNVKHIYKEGEYEVILLAYGLNSQAVGLKKNLVVSFDPPENLVVTIENDAAVSKRVNVTATADNSQNFDVYFGVEGVDTPITGNIGEVVSYTYQDAGLYTIRVVAKGAAIQTTEYTEDFEVTAILQPLTSAPNPAARADEDVISIFSAAYTNETGANYFPDWGQGGCCGSGWAMFDLNGDEMLQYTNLSYQGNEFGAPVDVSEMEYIHLDVWTADVLQTIEVSLISSSNGERPVVVDLNQNSWTSIDIPISDYTDQEGFTVADIFQLKYVGDPSGEGTVFIDNIYFFKASSLAPTIAGTWKVAPEAGSLAVGPAPGSAEWWSIDEAGVTQRACYFDDTFVFGIDGSFSNILGSETWIEPWQGGADACGTPVTPHDGSASATYNYNTATGVLTISGTGAYIGLSKVNNAGELTDPDDAPTSIIYNVSFIDINTVNVSIEAGTGTFWNFKLIKN